MAKTIQLQDDTYRDLASLKLRMLEQGAHVPSFDEIIKTLIEDNKA